MRLLKRRWFVLLAGVFIGVALVLLPAGCLALISSDIGPGEFDPYVGVYAERGKALTLIANECDVGILFVSVAFYQADYNSQQMLLVPVPRQDPNEPLTTF